MNSNFLNSRIFSNEEKIEIELKLDGKDLDSVKTKTTLKEEEKLEANPYLYDVSEEFILPKIDDGLVAVL